MVINMNYNKIDSKEYSLKERILKFLIENKHKYTILEISKKLGVDYKNVHQVINKLYPALIFKEKKGNINLVEIRLNPNAEIYNIEEKRTLDILKKNNKIRLIKEDIDSINYPFFIVLLFGSYASGIATDKSDIDICVLADNKEILRDIGNKLRLLPYKIQLQEFSIKEFVSMLNTKEENISTEIIKNNYILFGIENYYNLISRWMRKE